MGVVTENSEQPQPRPFNTKLECGLRLLFILKAVSPIPCDVQRLVYYDYLLVHSGDFDGPLSLHANVPLRGSQWVARRKLVSEALDLMCSRELTDKTFSEQGVTYTASDLTEPFLKYFESSYALRTAQIADWMARSFREASEKELSSLLASKIGQWQAEFYLDTQKAGGIS